MQKIEGLEINTKAAEMETETETETTLILILKLIFKSFKFGLYLFVTLLELFIKVIKILFLQDYQPFKKVVDSKNNFFNQIASKNINRYKIQFASEILARHEYNFQRSEQFLAQYKYLQDKLKEISNNEIKINDDIYKDIFKRISILVAEAENVALKEGYNHAKNTHYKLYDDEIYNDFVRDRVLKGEGEIDWKDLKERLEHDR